MLGFRGSCEAGGVKWGGLLCLAGEGANEFAATTPRSPPSRTTGRVSPAASARRDGLGRTVSAQADCVPL